MPSFTSYDGTELAYRVIGDGPPLVCVPGGPGRAGEYLGDLGGLAATRQLIIPDTRGTGASAMPADLSTCRVDRLAEDIEALRRHLGQERLDLLGHSAGGGVALCYATAHPDRLTRLVLANPSFAAIGLPSDTGVEEVLAGRAAEPWYAEALAGYRGMQSANTYADAQQHRLAFEPLMYGRWDEAAREHAAADTAQRSLPVSQACYAGYQPDVAALHARLAGLGAPVLLLAGERDLWPTARSVRQAAARFADATVAVLPGAGHYPWLDDPPAFRGAVDTFLAEARPGQLSR